MVAQEGNFQMPKAKAVKSRRRQRLAQDSPLGQPSTEDVQQVEKKISLISGIDSEEEQERIFAINSFARLVTEEPKTLSLVLEKEGVLPSIIKRILDPEVLVRTAASGAIRNLTSIADAKIFEKVLATDIITACLSVLNDKHDYDDPMENSADLVVNTLSTLTNICEHSDQSINAMLMAKIVQTLTKFLHPSLPLGVAIESLVLLDVITEENQDSFKAFTQDDITLLKVSMVNKENNLAFRVLVSSVLFNIFPESEYSEILKISLPALIQSLDYDPKSLFQEILALPADDKIHTQLSSDILDDDWDNKFKEWHNAVKSQIVSIGIFANLLSSDIGMNDSNDQPVATPFIINLFNEYHVFNKILPFCVFISGDIKTNLEKYSIIQKLFDSLDVLQTRSLGCINNILLSFPNEALGDTSSLWTNMFQLCGQAFDRSSTETDIQVTLTAILYSIIRKNHSVKIEEWQATAAHKLTCHPSEHIRSNTIGVFGYMVKTTIGQHVVKEVAQTLLKSLDDPSGWVITEALDLIYALFDDYYQEVYDELNFQQKLKDFLPRIKNQLKEAQGQVSELLYERLEEAVINIPAFLEYKRKQRKN
eukprot:TRINITY_DN2866_c0_g1_i1.p1 TRINITY_DN2866_c0_g1~~TRINITY_DN2866_c0_g1_i1.p1  ORF type:complete len:593 (+),score=118.62 TRINITY_DN2866_c0_g1_i1:3-1781(+)